MQTPPPGTPPRTPGTPPRTPPRTPDAISLISCQGLLFRGRGGVNKPPASPAKSPPPKPIKPQKNRPFSEVYAWLPLLKLMSFFSKLLGKGDFGTVHEFHLPSPPGTPQSPPIAVKEIKFETPGVCSTDLREEVKRLGSPGCVPGVACRTDSSLMIFMPLGVPLDKLDFSKMTAEMLGWVIQSVKDICMMVDKGVVADLKLPNFVFIPAGTATVITDAEGQPCMGPPTEFDQIVVCDLGTVDLTSGGTKKYGAFPKSESDAEQPDFEARLRNFKTTMLEALIRDAAKPSGKTIERIVADICTQFRFRYAAGEQYQAQSAQQLRF